MIDLDAIREKLGPHKKCPFYLVNEPLIQAWIDAAPLLLAEVDRLHFERATEIADELADPDRGMLLAEVARLAAELRVAREVVQKARAYQDGTDDVSLTPLWNALAAYDRTVSGEKR